MKFQNFKNIKYYYHKYIKWPIQHFFEYKSPIYIDFNVWKVFSEYWKCRKVFYKPLLKKYKLKVDESISSDYFFLETECHNKWLYIACHPIDYKYKFREIRYESVPYICIIWRNKVKYVYGLEAPLYEEYNGKYSKNNLLYYEGILNYLYKDNKDIYKTYTNHQWYRTYWLDKETYKKDIVEKVYIYNTLLPCIKQKYADKIIQLEYEKSKSKDNES